MGIHVSSSGNFDHFRDFAKNIKSGEIFSGLERFGRMGVEILASATPVETGITADSWSFIIREDAHGRKTIEWHNTNMADGTPVVILIHYGHGTGTGGYVQGRDFINPVMREVFDEIADEMWRKVVTA